ncbi:P-loop containing nucleoside triphosphate hydrolase protein [Coprinopsis marcescibilis]|uniref:P-loop containing nucleoside triphosphate hydrolase protein n=1 Tax=Coprinopsis marcescibilis TaxID=230819 RepID=A0A5C3LBA6_COPMA|nr:P-loop containing nucleoside triphosphate hydrolase protein [Coprinopsis marcescibilis]
MSAETVRTRVILIGVGGATCSGKTTLAKHLNRLLPDSVIIHQDDFAPPMEEVPIHPVLNIQDWDSAPGAISWTRLIDTLKVIKSTGDLPPDHRSHDHLNEQKSIPIDEEAFQKWSSEFKSIQKELFVNRKENVVFGLLDGFLLYWHPEVIAEIDVRLMLRVPEQVLKQRRHERHGYHTAVQSDLVEGALWRDPPNYWEDIVYPAYVEAHRDLFIDGDVENGRLSGNKVEGLIMLETLNQTMTEAIEQSCSTIKQALERLQSDKVVTPGTCT